MSEGSVALAPEKLGLSITHSPSRARGSHFGAPRAASGACGGPGGADVRPARRLFAMAAPQAAAAAGAPARIQRLDKVRLLLPLLCLCWGAFVRGEARLLARPWRTDKTGSLVWFISPQGGVRSGRARQGRACATQLLRNARKAWCGQPPEAPPQRRHFRTGRMQITLSVTRACLHAPSRDSGAPQRQAGWLTHSFSPISNLLVSRWRAPGRRLV